MRSLIQDFLRKDNHVLIQRVRTKKKVVRCALCVVHQPGRFLFSSFLPGHRTAGKCASGHFSNNSFFIVLKFVNYFCIIVLKWLSEVDMGIFRVASRCEETRVSDKPVEHCMGGCCGNLQVVVGGNPQPFCHFGDASCNSYITPLDSPDFRVGLGGW